MLKLYHTYKKKLVVFKPIKKGEVKIYNCGPTVYDFATIGNLRYFTFCDFLRRTIEYLGYKVIQVMNITDVGHLTMTEAQKKEAELEGIELEITDTDEGLDRMRKAAKREGLSVWEIAEKYTQAIFGKNWKELKEFEKDGDFGKLNLKKPHFLPIVTDHIQEMIVLIKDLEEKGYTYKTKEAIYFNIQKFPKYEKLLEQKFDEMRKGERADATDPDRKHPADFRLWQLDQPDHPMQWDSPWGKGFPGWHIECSAMSKKYLGQPFDIHTGGEDHIRLHHLNEIAQSEAAYDKDMANYWMHGLFLTVDGKRMGKSLGNAYTLADIEKKGFDPLDLRYFFLQAHYRTKQNFTWENLKSAANARKKLVRELRNNSLKQEADKKYLSKKWKDRFIETLEDDLITPKALAVVWDLLKSDEKQASKLATIIDFDKVLGLRLKEAISEPFGKIRIKNKERDEIEGLIKERETTRSKKDWKEADKIRERLKEKYNVELEDTKKGTIWNLKE